MTRTLVVAMVVTLALMVVACKGAQGPPGPAGSADQAGAGEDGAIDPSNLNVAEEAAILDGAYSVHWDREGGVDGVVSLDSARGLYNWSGKAPTAAQRSFHFVDAPQGRYTVQMKLDVVGKTLVELPDGATVAVVNFDPERVGYESVDAEALVEVRVDQRRHELYMHSVVSEFEGWKIARGLKP